MKYKDYFLKLKEQGKINNEDYNKFLETVPDGELPDAIFTVLDSTFLTTERALTHKDVAGKLRREIMDPVDTNLKAILKYLPADDVLQIEREESTYKKMHLINEAIPKAIAKASKAPNDEEAKKKIEESQRVIQELTEKFNKLNEATDANNKKLESDYNNKIKSYRLDSELEKLANTYTFADAYTETRSTLTKAMLDDIKAKNRLDLVDNNGESLIQIQDEHGAPLFENNGNTPVTIKSLLDGKLKPFLKVNNAGDGKEGNGQQAQQHQAKKSFTVQDGQQAPRQGASVTVAM
jgi:hypothetical protein